MYLAITILIPGLYVIYIQSYQTMRISFISFFGIITNIKKYKIIFSHIFHIPTNKSDLHLLISFEHFASNNV